ncbi:MAG: YqaE/Pmp3 family membrane protein [Anaerolineae bacterium]
MDIGRLIVAILLPPLAVIDKGCAVVLVVTLLWFAGWIPGVIAAVLLGAMADDKW